MGKRVRALHLFYGVRGGADQSVIKRKTKPILWGQVRVNDLGIGAVCLTQGGKQPMCLLCKIILFSNGEEDTTRKRRALLVIAKDGALA